MTGDGVLLTTTTAGRTGTTRRFFTVVAVAAAAVTVPAAIARGIPDSTPITIHGTGWGHHVGIPHWATQGQAVQGWQYKDILDYWYPGTAVESVANVYAPIRSAPDPIRVGIDYVWTGTRQYRPFMWQRFSAINGNVSICLQGESKGACSYVAQPGETWEFGYTDSIGGECYLRKNGVNQGIDPSECETHLYWNDQPTTRVSFPGSDVGRVFARGHVEFVPAVGTVSPYNGWTGFHLVIEMPFEEYLYGLAEVPPSWGLEALKANAVASRSYAVYRTIYNLGRVDCSCDIVWDTTGQWYLGYRTNSDLTEGDITYGARWRQAVDATAGEVRTFAYESNGNRRIAETYYSTISGGATENVWDMWNPNADSSYKAKYAYLGWKPDQWSSLYNGNHSGYPKVTNAVWAKNTTAGAIRNALTEGGVPIFDEILSIEIVNRRPSGSPDVIRVIGLKDGSQVARNYTGNQLQARLGLVSHFIQGISGLHSPERWAGADRYSTSADVSKRTHPGGSEIAYLAVGTTHPDALAGGPAAAKEGAPILLVRPDSLPAETAAELLRLDPATVVVLGGPAAVAEQVLLEVRGILPSADVTRRWGADRYATAAAVSAAVFDPGVNTVFVVTGEDFPDALIAAPAAVHLGSPLLLVRSDSVPATTSAEIQRLAPARIVVVGGTAAVNDATLNALRALVPDTSRISAADRYALSATVSQMYFPTTDVAYVAVGTTFADALTAGPASAVLPAPILLVRDTSLPAAVASEMQRLRPTRVVILGGPAAVSTGVEAQLKWLMG